MNELIGLNLVYLAIAIGTALLFGVDFTWKEKVLAVVGFEVFIILLSVGLYIACG